MNLIRVSVLILFLEVTKSSATVGSSTTKFNKISLSKGIKLSDNITTGNTQNKSKFSSSTNTIFKPTKKWKIGRVTNKQFGIIHILWQKTKVFIDHNYADLTCKVTTIKVTPIFQTQVASETGITKLSTTPKKLQTSTPSYIEFYYMDQFDDKTKGKKLSNTKLQMLTKINKTNINRSSNKKSSIPSLFKNLLYSKVGQGYFYRNKLNKSKGTTLVSKTPFTVTTKGKIRGSKHSEQRKKFRLQQTTNMFTRRTSANFKMRENSETHPRKNNSYDTEFVTDTIYDASFVSPVTTSTDYDKVKFFEMYDINTPRLQSYVTTNLSNTSYNNNKREINDLNDERMLSHNPNENTGYQRYDNKTRYVKKHIRDLYSTEKESNIGVLQFSSNTSIYHVSFQNNSNLSRPIIWTEFPFVAVYIYEPSQVHCDAAGISPHWLVGAASCLSRYRKGLRGGGLSAFVTFCSDDWRKPQMISYVKRTLMHPLYRPKDRTRRLFNAGLIQVVNSMADTCSGWRPASLISHQYTPDETGSIGVAVGWGLDRYGESYTATNIPRHALMIYESRVFSQTCPGTTDYSQVKSSDEAGVSNVYCLLLPPYLAEENDTVHGALLLIGGKLLALYLKEERRPWGLQSAQYTGIWRLLPWLVETAREPDESFHFDL